MIINGVNIQAGAALSKGAVSNKPVLQDQSSQSFEDRVSAKNAKIKKSEQQAQQDATGLRALITTYPGGNITADERAASKLRVIDIYVGDLPRVTDSLESKIDVLEDEVATQMPDIARTDWDFSIDENGGIIVKADHLNDADKEKLASIISKSGITEDLTEARDLMVEFIEEDRTKAMYSTSIGKFDLTNENFSEIINFREYVDGASSSPIGHGYALHDQLDARAEVVYNKLTTVDIYV
ncbi:hypothetical protein [Bacterioplanoides sp. SCSIO 12839]|uniref:hypothetical protein n=1 Tax=Bacterioplanoides sp. SCSIO 12839 TaxID=2829569 RepID=UPI002107F5BA|nr:hypothetical protein [Bacterioplanoides sp. SCSIO 12839]UTW49702.1 hypothetical protein KFF03_07400 [Bacterioplanoides sp. SCSIO 12839]